MKRLFCVLIIVFVFCLGCSNSSSLKESDNEILSIDVETVYSMLDDDIYILDVREAYEYSSGHIKKSYNVPLSEIENIDKHWITSDSMIIVYCHSGNRSRKAAQKLVDMGYTNVYDMGGIIDWNYELIVD